MSEPRLLTPREAEAVIESSLEKKPTASDGSNNGREKVSRPLRSRT
jgi:hypothetical protein